MTFTLRKLLNPIELNRLKTLRRLSRLVSSNGRSSLVIGAFARDLLFYNRYDISTGAGTNDMDVTIEIFSWSDFDAIAGKLADIGFKQEKLPEHPEKFADTNGVELDMIPFGGISGNSKTLIWPDGSPWNTMGIKEALENSWSLSLGTDKINVASAASIVMMKIFAVTDRPDDRKQKDVRDIKFILRNYLDIGNRRRLAKGAGKHKFLIEAEGDLDMATARLMGFDIGVMLTHETFSALESILDNETKSHSRCVITHELGKYFNGDFKESRKCLSSLLMGTREGYKGKTSK
jgi:predicted nucleotidyltransferase